MIKTAKVFLAPSLFFMPVRTAKFELCQYKDIQKDLVFENFTKLCYNYTYKDLHIGGEPMYNRHLETFIAVADLGSFSKAAEALYISSTAVIKQINLLEQELVI